jgi:hypothetical protein
MCVFFIVDIRTIGVATDFPIDRRPMLAEESCDCSARGALRKHTTNDFAFGNGEVYEGSPPLLE